MNYSKIFLNLVLLVLSPIVSLAQDLSTPIHVKVDEGWKVFYPLKEQYVSFTVQSPEIELDSPYNMVLSEKIGVNFTFADKTQWDQKKNLLDGYAEWELGYMRNQFNQLESRTIQNIKTPNKNILVAEVSFFSKDTNSHNIAYIIAIAAQDGVVAVTVSSSYSEKDHLMKIVKPIINSAAITTRPLTLEDLKNLK